MKNDISKRLFVGLGGSTCLLSSLGIAAIGLSSVAAFAENGVRQFVAEDFHGMGGGVVWESSDVRSTLSSEHAATNGWSLAWSDGGRVCFDASTSPMAFPDSATGRVTRAFAVAACEEAADHATLFDASCSVRFMPSPFPGDGRTFYESQITNAVAVSIDAVATNLFPSASGLQVIEAEFEPPCPLNELYVGGAPATAAWAQSWRGGVAELILLADAPTDAQLNALRRYLALKHGLAVPTESDGGIVATLAAMGVATDGLFNSVFLVK